MIKTEPLMDCSHFPFPNSTGRVEFAGPGRI
jgi:hypothetical protein